MKAIIILVVALSAASVLCDKEQWLSFKEKHSKVYKNVVEEYKRYKIFQDNLKTINSHNTRYEAGLETYFMAINKFADMTADEFSSMLRRQGPQPKRENTTLHQLVKDVPAKLDWRENGAVLEVKDQGQCGSCWAFSATGSLEGQNAIHNDQRIPLSEQQLLDCSASYGNGDCLEGGEMEYAFDYIKDNGINKESEYPYEAVQGECRAVKDSVVEISGYKKIERNELALKNAVGSVGPISVAIYAELIQFYGGGIFSSPDCYNDDEYLDHGVLVVGYGENPSKYWIIKNSWASDWGEDGYFRLARDADQCGIALDTSYPVLA